jgi:hypothetical protein
MYVLDIYRCQQAMMNFMQSTNAGPKGDNVHGTPKAQAAAVGSLFSGVLYRN